MPEDGAYPGLTTMRAFFQSNSLANSRHREPCGVISAPRRLLTLDEERELLPKEEVLCGEGATRAA